MKLFNAFVLFFGLTAVLTFFGACSKENVSDTSKETEVNDLKAQIEDLRNQVQVVFFSLPAGLNFQLDWPLWSRVTVAM